MAMSKIVLLDCEGFYFSANAKPEDSYAVWQAKVSSACLEFLRRRYKKVSLEVISARNSVMKAVCEKDGVVEEKYIGWRYLEHYSA